MKTFADATPPLLISLTLALAMMACGDGANSALPSALPDAGTASPEDAAQSADAGDFVGDDAGGDGGDGGDEPWAFDDAEKELADEGALEGPRAHFDPALITPAEGTSATPAQFLAFPFPADHRRHADGKVRFDDFPRPSSLAQSLGNKLLDRYLSPVGGVDGFSLNAAVHVAFDEELDLSAISTEPEDFLAAEAPFKIIDIDPSSPERGQIRPLRWEYQSTEGNYAAAKSLAIAPAWGFPLRESTTYALVITRAGIRGADSGLPLRQPLLLSALLANRAEKPEALAGVTDALYEELRSAYAPLRAALHYRAIDIGEVAVATVFTTQNVTKNLRRIANHLKADLARGAWVPQASYATTNISYWNSFCRRAASADTWATCTWNWSKDPADLVTLYQLAATFNGRNYQQGKVPYLFEGGHFRFNASNTPVGFREEKLTLAVTIPETPMATADGCVPIVEIAHGTTGSALSGLGDKTALRLAARGIATVGMDQPLHGDRFKVDNYEIPNDNFLGTLLGLFTVQMTDKDLILELANFNFLNVDSARTSMRQSAIDTMALTHLIERGGLDVPAEFSPTGAPIRFCRDKIGFFGHSQGALSGAIAAGPEHRIGAWLFSAGGGGLGITILDRKDFGDFPSILGALFGLKGGSEALSELHVLMTAIQTVVDVTDPINYAPFWMRDEKLGKPTSQLLTSGLNDSQTPHRSARALASAAHLSPVQPLVLALPEFDWAGIAALEAPLSGNNPTSTNAFLQWDGADRPDNIREERWSGHFLVYDRPEAINASMRFLQTYFAPESSDGLPLIERDPQASVKASSGERAGRILAAMPLEQPTFKRLGK